jgi:hypothetical protein
MSTLLEVCLSRLCLPRLDSRHLFSSRLVATDASALERGEAWLLDNLPRLRRADGVAIYNVWSHAYGIQALAQMVRWAAHDPSRQERIRR